MFGMENLSCMLPLNSVRQAPSLNHGHESSQWRECFFFGSWLSWLALLDCSSLVALLHHICWRIRPWWWSVVSYCTGHRLLGLHPFLECSAETKEFPAPGLRIKKNPLDSSPRSAPIDEVLPRQCPCLRAFDLWSALWDLANSTAIRRKQKNTGFYPGLAPW
jgi:hypothetical protein